MGSLVKIAAPVAGGILGGPLGAAAGGFLGNTLTGGDFGESLIGGVTSGATNGLGNMLAPSAGASFSGGSTPSNFSSFGSSPIGARLSVGGSVPPTASSFGASSIGNGLTLGGVTPVSPSFGAQFMSGLGFGSDPWANAANAGKLATDALPSGSPAPAPSSLLLPARTPIGRTLLDTLNFRSMR